MCEYVKAVMNSPATDPYNTYCVSLDEAPQTSIGEEIGEKEWRGDR